MPSTPAGGSRLTGRSRHPHGRAPTCRPWPILPGQSQRIESQDDRLQSPMGQWPAGTLPATHTLGRVAGPTSSNHGALESHRLSVGSGTLLAAGCRVESDHRQSIDTPETPDGRISGCLDVGQRHPLSPVLATNTYRHPHPPQTHRHDRFCRVHRPLVLHSRRHLRQHPVTGRLSREYSQSRRTQHPPVGNSRSRSR